MPRWVELGVAYAADEDSAVASVKQYWAGTFIPALFSERIHTPALSEENGKAVGSDTITKSRCISADPEEHVRFAKQYIEYGFNELFFHSAGPDQRAFIEGYGRDVLPRLRHVEDKARTGLPAA